MHCCSGSPKKTAKCYARVGFGLALAFVGFAHYQDPQFADSVGRGLGALEPLGTLWGYILPGLMIVGGLLLSFGIYSAAAAGISAVALASIPAGLMLKSAVTGVPLNDTMPPAMNALVWLIVLLMVLKGKCGSSCAPMACGPCACPACDAPVTSSVETEETVSTVKSSAPAAVSAKKVAPKKKVTVKKTTKKAVVPKKVS